MSKRELALGIVVAIIVAWAVHEFWPKPGEPTIVVREIPDSAAYRMAMLELKNVQGKLEEQTVRADSATKRSSAWRQKADRFRRLYESMIDSSDSVVEISSRLDTIVTTAPDSAGRTYRDTLNAIHKLPTDSWDLRLGYQPRQVFYIRRDSTITIPVPEDRTPWWVWPIVAASFLAGYELAK